MTMDQAVDSMFAPSKEVTQDEVQEETIETEVAQDAWSEDQAEAAESAAGQGYIQQGMREVAEIKKEAGGVYQALQQERQQLSQIYNQLTSGQVPLQAQTHQQRNC
jgi:aminoglycoside phosphotransferase